MKRHCDQCNCPLPKHNTTGTCWRCRSDARCPVCSGVYPGKGKGLWCEECKRIGREINAVLSEPTPDSGPPQALVRGQLIQPVRVRVRALTNAAEESN